MTRTDRRTGALAPLVLGPALLLLTACTSSSVARSAPATTPVVRSAADVWRSAPGSAPPGLSEATLVLDEPATGARTFTVPDLAPYSTVLLAITCGSPDEYVLQLGSPAAPAPVWTAGASCAGPRINTYTSAPLAGLPPLTRLYVQVSPETQYVVTVYGTPRRS